MTQVKAILDAFVRIVKGIYLFWMFFLFGTGIAVGLVTVVPLFFLANILAGPSWNRMQRFNRLSFSIFLFLLRIGSLIRSLPTEQEPVDGPCIIVANHPGLFDVLFVIRDISSMSVVVKDSLFPWMGPILRAAGYVRARKAKGAFPARQPLRDIQELLAKGQKVLIFPEGSRSPLGKLNDFHSWAVGLAQKAGVPLQPLAIHNRPPFLSHESRWYYPSRTISLLRLEFLEPLWPTGDRTEEMKKVKRAIGNALARGEAGSLGASLGRSQ